VELVLVEGDGEGRVCGEDQGGIALAPVLDHGDVDGGGAGCFKDGHGEEGRMGKQERMRMNEEDEKEKKKKKKKKMRNESVKVG